MIARFLSVLSLLVVAACREEPGDEYLAMTGKVFIFNYRIAEATYVLTFKKLKPLPDGTVVEGQFENPAGGAPLVVTSMSWPKIEKITLESPPLRCVRKGHPYSINIRLMDSGGNVLQNMQTTLTSTLDQSILPDRPLVVGPVYAPNPDLTGHPDGHIGVAGATGCPDRQGED